MNVLISPAHYYFSDKFGSEPGYAYSLVKYIGSRLPHLDVIVGVVDIQHPLPSNINIIPVYKKRSHSPAVELLKYILFYPLVCLKYIQLHKKYDIVHHMFPTSIKTIDPLFVLVRLFSPKTKIVIGPLQLLSELTNKQDLSVMLVGRQNKSLLLTFLPPFYQLLIFITTPLNILTFYLADVIVYSFKLIGDYYSGMFKNKTTTVIPMGVDLPVSASRKIVNKNKEKITFLSVGRLDEHKGVIYLLEAFAKLAEKFQSIQLYIVGDGILKETLIAYVKNHGLLRKVTFTGRVERAKVSQWYKKADIFCLPSLIDTNPVVVMEAMSYGLPVIASDVGAVPEIISDAGIVVNKADPTQLAQAMEDLLRNGVKRESMGKKGREKIIRTYNWTVISGQWINLYQSLVI